MSIPNIDKLLQYLQCVSKHPINVDGKVIGDQITDIRLNSKFFYNDSCQNCGSCDPPESNLYTASEYQAILDATEEQFTEYGLEYSYLEELRNNLIQTTWNINGLDVPFWMYEQQENILYLPSREKEVPRCSWCFQCDEHKYKCRIHPVESITCIMPHLRIFHVSGSHRSSIGISQFGRNWALGCPVILTPPKNEEEFNYNKQNRINKLRRLMQVGLDMNIDTYLPEVIQYVEATEYDNHLKRLHKNVIKTKQIKLFTLS